MSTGHKALPLRKEPGQFGTLPFQIDLYRVDCECGWGSQWQEHPQFVRDAHARHVERQTHVAQVIGL